MVLSLMALAIVDLADAEDVRRASPQMNFVQYALGQFTRDEFIARIGRGALEPIIWMNKHLPQDAKVLYVGEARVYYAKNPVLWSTAFDQHPLAAMSKESTSTEDLLVRLRAHGVTHVYVNQSELARLRNGYRYMSDAKWNLIDDLLQNHAQSIHTSGSRIVYALTS